MEIRVQRGFGRSRWAIIWLVSAAAMFAQDVLDNDAVLKLVKAGVSESQLIPHGYGKTDFVSTNDTDEGRAQNRRVELVPND